MTARRFELYRLSPELIHSLLRAPILRRFKLYCSPLGRRILLLAVRLKFHLSNLTFRERSEFYRPPIITVASADQLQNSIPTAPAMKFYPLRLYKILIKFYCAPHGIP